MAVATRAHLDVEQGGVAGALPLGAGGSYRVDLVTKTSRRLPELCGE